MGYRVAPRLSMTDFYFAKNDQLDHFAAHNSWNKIKLFSSPVNRKN